MDKIIIQDKEKGRLEMEVVLTFSFHDRNYVIYKDDNDYFIAKYNEENDLLDTNLNEEEITYGEKVLEEVLKNVKN